MSSATIKREFEKFIDRINRGRPEIGSIVLHYQRARIEITYDPPDKKLGYENVHIDAFSDVAFTRSGKEFQFVPPNSNPHEVVPSAFFQFTSEKITELAFSEKKMVIRTTGGEIVLHHSHEPYETLHIGPANDADKFIF